MLESRFFLNTRTGPFVAPIDPGPDPLPFHQLLPRLDASSIGVTLGTEFVLDQ